MKINKHVKLDRVRSPTEKTYRLELLKKSNYWELVVAVVKRAIEDYQHNTLSLINNGYFTKQQKDITPEKHEECKLLLSDNKSILTYLDEMQDIFDYPLSNKLIERTGNNIFICNDKPYRITYRLHNKNYNILPRLTKKYFNTHEEAVKFLKEHFNKVQNLGGLEKWENLKS